MGNSLVMKAAKNLVPMGIFLKSSKVFTHVDFNRHTCEEAELEVQIKSSPSPEYQTLLDENKRKGIMLFGFDAGVRLVDSSLNEKDDGFLQLEILATYEIEYQLIKPSEFSEDAMSHFLNLNVPHHVWPYWREFIQSMSSRIGIPEIIIPFMIPNLPKENKKVKK